MRVRFTTRQALPPTWAIAILGTRSSPCSSSSRAGRLVGVRGGGVPLRGRGRASSAVALVLGVTAGRLPHGRRRALFRTVVPDPHPFPNREGFANATGAEDDGDPGAGAAGR